MNLKDVSKYEVTRALWGEFRVRRESRSEL